MRRACHLCETVHVAAAPVSPTSLVSSVMQKSMAETVTGVWEILGLPSKNALTASKSFRMICDIILKELAFYLLKGSSHMIACCTSVLSYTGYVY
mmetsp:Transcript_21319/g.30532  ORF Transcript_21319/g.30532 Transcript_21319/m.30532 type:complete len:95 (-) Transcript_21319:356-640(-)